MFSNSGKILKVLAYITFIGGIIGGIIAMACVGDDDLIWIGLPIIGGSFITAVACYALGDAQDKIKDQYEILTGLTDKVNNLISNQAPQNKKEEPKQNRPKVTSFERFANPAKNTNGSNPPSQNAPQKIYCSVCHQYKDANEDHPYFILEGNIVCFDCDQEKNNSNK